ncbi:MAG: hypothetical protein ACE5HY_04930 [Candidatus Hydrothermarchaeales archaeon]
MINPNFSFTYALVYTYRANTLFFIIILGIGGLVGGVIGTGAEYTIKNTADYVSEHQEPAIKKVKENAERIIKKAREQIQKYQKKKGE